LQENEAKTKMAKDYTHELGKQIRSISGRYMLEREERIEMEGLDIFYVVGNAVVDSSCCGVWGCRYALVPGYVKKWKYRSDAQGNAISLVDPIADEDERRKIKGFLMREESINDVQFW